MSGSFHHHLLQYDIRRLGGTIPVSGTDYSLPYITRDLDVNRPHAITGVDKAHAAGIKGKGIKIGIIDTGVDHRHPSLGGCFGSGGKIAFEYDFVGGDYGPDIRVRPVEGPDSLAICISGGHWTHAAGKCSQVPITSRLLTVHIVRWEG